MISTSNRPPHRDLNLVNTREVALGEVDNPNPSLRQWTWRMRAQIGNE